MSKTPNQVDLFGSYESVNPYEKKRLMDAVAKAQRNYAAHPPKNCSVCGSNRAYWSKNRGKTWECTEHRQW